MDAPRQGAARPKKAVAAPRADPARLSELDVAFAFKRLDVDAMLDEVTADQFDEWRAYLAIRPHGWRATNLATARIAWAVLQSHSAKTVDERRLMIQLDRPDPAASLAHDRARMETVAVSGEIRERLRLEREKRRAAAHGRQTDQQP